MPVEQIKAKRSGIGLRAVDHDRAYRGFTLFAPQSGSGKVYLIDIDGEVVHTWQMPYPPGNYGYLTERGTLFYNGKVTEDSNRFISRQPWKGGAALEADWNGRVLWELRHPDHHHDGIRLRNGNVLLLCLSPLPKDVVPKITGGIPGTDHKGEMYADYLVEMTTDGGVVWEWRTWEHLDPETDRVTAIQERREEWTHGNGIAELPNGNIVVSFRKSRPSLSSNEKPGRLFGSSEHRLCAANTRRRRCRTAIFCFSTTVHIVWIIPCRSRGSSRSSRRRSGLFGNTRRKEKATFSVRGFQTRNACRTATH
jgi:hypothetical protein